MTYVERPAIVRCDECDGHGCEDCGGTGKREASYACRRCSECVGEEHHFIDGDMLDERGSEFACKHCDATAFMCANCDVPVPGRHELCVGCRPRSLLSDGGTK